MSNNTKSINQLTYNAIAPLYEANYGDIPASYEYAEYIIEQLRGKSQPHILDLGCGSGTILKLFGDSIPNSVLVGIDFSNELLKIAKAKFSQANLICQDFAAYNPDAQFNVIIATFSLIHSSDDELESMIPKIYSWLKNGGYFYSAFILGEGEQTEPEALDPNHKTYFNFHSQDYLEKLFKSNGFKIIKQKIFHTKDAYEDEDDIYFVLQK